MSKDNLYKQFFDRLDFILDYDDYHDERGYFQIREMITSQLQPDNYFMDEELIGLFKKIRSNRTMITCIHNTIKDNLDFDYWYISFSEVETYFKDTDTFSLTRTINIMFKNRNKLTVELILENDIYINIQFIENGFVRESKRTTIDNLSFEINKYIREDR